MKLVDFIESAEDPLEVALPLDLEQELMDYFRIYTNLQDQAQ